jgi:hypothetical protein
MEVGDDDMMKDWNHGLMIIRKSWMTTEIQRQGSEDDSQTHGNRERFKFFHT